MPENIFQLQQASKTIGTKSLFVDSFLSINQGEHVGVIGANGAGKSTLFKILAGQLELDSGEYIQKKGLRIGYLAQEDSWLIDQSLVQLLEQKQVAQKWQMIELAKSLGVNAEYCEMPLKELSGGYRMRAQLVSIIADQPDLLLLDEPTNYLDLESLIFLETFLLSFKKAFLIISHDRKFIKTVAQSIVEVEAGGFQKFPGDIDDYFEQKQMISEHIDKQNLTLSAKRKQITDFVTRFGAKASKATQAQSKLKQLEKLKLVSKKSLPVQAVIRLPATTQTGKEVLNIHGADFGYGDKTVLDNVRVELKRGDRVGVVGVNGAGKSTLLKGISSKLPPLNDAEVQYGLRVRVSYFAQHLSDSLDSQATVLEEFERNAHKSVVRQDALDLAGSLLFSGPDVEKKIGVLSGGEKTRVALGKILLERAPVLILDEPTNHLDFATVEALTQALCKFDGTLVAVSHDRSFIARVSTKILQINNGKVNFYPGNYEEYIWSLTQGAFAFDQGTTSEGEQAGSVSKNVSMDSSDKPKSTKKINRKHLQSQIKQIQKQANKLEREIAKSTESLAEISKKMMQPAADFSALGHQSESIQSKIEQAELDWLEAQEELEALNALIADK